MFKRPPMWSQEGNGLARAIFRISDRLDVLYLELARGISPTTYVDTWNECRHELDELQSSVADLNSRVRLITNVTEVTYRTCILQLITCVDMQIMGCWISVRANDEFEEEIAARCFELSRQTSAAYANAIRMVTRKKVDAEMQDVILREFVKSFREELLPVKTEGDALIVKMEAENRMPNA